MLTKDQTFNLSSLKPGETRTFHRKGEIVCTSRTLDGEIEVYSENGLMILTIDNDGEILRHNTHRYSWDLLNGFFIGGASFAINFWVFALHRNHYASHTDSYFSDWEDRLNGGVEYAFAKMDTETRKGFIQLLLAYYYN